MENLDKIRETRYIYRDLNGIHETPSFDIANEKAEEPFIIQTTYESGLMTVSLHQ